MCPKLRSPLFNGRKTSCRVEWPWWLVSSATWFLLTLSARDWLRAFRSLAISESSVRHSICWLTRMRATIGIRGEPPGPRVEHEISIFGRSRGNQLAHAPACFLIVSIIYFSPLLSLKVFLFFHPNEERTSRGATGWVLFNALRGFKAFSRTLWTFQQVYLWACRFRFPAFPCRRTM